VFEMMNKALNFIAENNIQPEVLFDLVDKVGRMDLSNEDNIRQIINSVSKMANRKIDKSQEDRIVKEILNNGVNESIFDML
jgi:hypothetical protein